MTSKSKVEENGDVGKMAGCVAERELGGREFSQSCIQSGKGESKSDMSGEDAWERTGK